MTLEQRLEEAEEAYHQLVMGKSAVEFRDSNGELVRYALPNAPRLAAYIAELKRQLGQTCSSPAGVIF